MAGHGGRFVLVIAGLRKLRQERCCKFTVWAIKMRPYLKMRERRCWSGRNRNPDCVGISEEQTR